MNHYKVYHFFDFIGETWAKSPEKAINNVRFRVGMRYKPMTEFSAKEII